MAQRRFVNIFSSTVELMRYRLRTTTQNRGSAIGGHAKKAYYNQLSCVSVFAYNVSMRWEVTNVWSEEEKATS